VSTTAGSPRQVLLAITVGDDIVLAAKAAISAAAVPGSRVLVVHVAAEQSRLDGEPREQIETTLAQAIKLIEKAGFPATSVVAPPSLGVNVIASIAEEWHADVTVFGVEPEARHGDHVPGEVPG
jgi:nucleotide-binding universal stress UspA family protein